MATKRVEIIVAPGTNPTPDQTELKTLHYTDTDKVYFEHGDLRKLPGWVVASFTTTSGTLRGAARSMFSYLSTIAHTIIGTNTRLYTYEQGALTNLTPLLTATTTIANSLDNNYVALANNPLATTNGSKDIVITSAAHKLFLGDSVVVSGASTTNGIPNTEINATHTVRAVAVNTFTITVLTTAATSTGSGGGAAVIARTGIITATAAAHGMLDGDRTKLLAATAVGGVLAADINIEHVIRRVTANTFDVMCASKATSSVTAGGGASTTYQKPIAKGAINFSQGIGYGGGLYGVGLYGVAKIFVNAYQYPRIWSSGRFGNDWVGTPGDQKGVYIWQQNLAVAPTALTNAPTAVNWVFIYNNAVFTLGASGVNNRIKGSDTGDATNWTIGTDSNAYEDDIEGAGKFISQASVGNVSVLYTENEAYTFSATGDENLYDTRPLLLSDGLIAPKARAMVEDRAFWLGQALDIYCFDGGSLSKVDYNTCHDWMVANLNYQQRWKIFCRVDTTRNTFWICFPTGSNTEPNKYLLVNYKEQHVTLGNLSRTAAEDPIAFPTSPYMAYSASESVDGILYRHDYGHDDDISPMSAYAETNYVMIGEGDRTMEIMDIIPDSTQTGTIDLTIYTKDYAQSTEEFTYGPYAISATTTFIDPQAAGRQRKYRLSQDALNEDFVLGKWFENIKQGPPL